MESVISFFLKKTKYAFFDENCGEEYIKVYESEKTL